VDDCVLLVGFVDGEVDHEPRGRCAVPVLLVVLEQHPVAWADDLDRPASALAQADAFGYEDGLTQWVAVPVGAGTWHEVHEVGLHAEGRRGSGDGVNVDVAGEPVAGSLAVPMELRVMCMGGS
jgi:hypothetical protein